MTTSFKTTTLIAAIGMSIAVGFSLATQFIGAFTDIDLYVHPIRMQALWRVQDVIWWASTLLFFWGMFRYPDQLPELNKWSKRIAIAMIGVIVFSFVDGLFYTSSTDPLWLKIFRYSLCFLTKGSYVAALWWCYAKSANRQAVVIRYISLIATLLCGAVVLYIIANTVAWWFEFWPTRIFFYRYTSMFVFHSIIYILTAACALIGIHTKETSITITDEKYKPLKRITIAGWLLLATSLVTAVLLVVCISIPDASDEILTCLFLLFLALPAIAGIYLLIACRALQKAYDIIEKQQKQYEQ